MNTKSSVVTLLFTDIDGSTRRWEQDPERMQLALARHDALSRAAVEARHGAVVKSTGDGVYAAFANPIDAIGAALELQQGLADPTATNGIPLLVRCGMHVGIVERRDNDYFGNPVNRAARIMRAAHGGQVLASRALVDLVGDRLPDGVSLRDLGSVRLRDLASCEHVYQILHARLRRDFPALRSLDATPNNLPLQLTSFVGRERELAEVRRLLGTARLVTLLGAGGIGKTRLALQIAAELVDDHPDGVWFVELAPLSDERLVPQAVASVLGVQEEAGRPVVEALVKYVADRKVLLILDNCEHLLRACAELGEQLLRSGPDVKILASSREHLHVAVEVAFPVPALAVPDPDRRLTLDALTQCEAVRLFVDRSVAVHPGFTVNDQNAAAVGEICRHLDGIPLAIELAAARVRGLSVQNIAARLNDCFRLLTSGSRTALPRQQTLRAMIDWSHGLLTQQERTLMRRLAVFAGGWTLEAAEAVGAGGDVEAPEVLELLTALVDKSLVAVEADGGRYRLLETVRQYAQEKLRESGEADPVRTRHLRYFLALAESTRPKLLGREQGQWLARLGLERENLLSAHAWCDGVEGGAEWGLRLVYWVNLYWLHCGLLGLGHRLAVEALRRPGAQQRTGARCWASFAAGQLAYFLGRADEARGHLQDSLSIARDLGDKNCMAAALILLGVAFHGDGDFAAARRLLAEALTLAREVGDDIRLSAALNGLAELHRAEGALDDAEPLYNEALLLARKQGDRATTALYLVNLAMVSIGLGASDRARALVLEALSIVEEIGSRQRGRAVLDVTAGLAALLEDWHRAAQLYGAAQAQGELMGLRREAADESFLAPRVARMREALGAAAFGDAEAAGRSLTYEDAMNEARVLLAAGA